MQDERATLAVPPCFRESGHQTQPGSLRDNGRQPAKLNEVCDTRSGWRFRGDFRPRRVSELPAICSLLWHGRGDLLLPIHIVIYVVAV